MVNNFSFLILYCTNACAKKRDGCGRKKGRKFISKKGKIGMDENPLDRGLFIPLIKNETKQERANRILSMMEESNDRLNRVLEIFNRMNR